MGRIYFRSKPTILLKHAGIHLVCLGVEVKINLEENWQHHLQEHRLLNSLEDLWGGMIYYFSSGEEGLLGMLSIAIFVWLFIFEKKIHLWIIVLDVLFYSYLTLWFRACDEIDHHNGRVWQWTGYSSHGSWDEKTPRTEGSREKIYPPKSMPQVTQAL